jgi:hypothetical protein
MTTYPLDFSPRALLSAAIDSVRNPKAGVARLVATDLPTPVLWTALVAVVAVSVVMGQGALLLVAGGAPSGNAYLANPLVMWVIQLALLVVMVYAIHFVGQWMGGLGAFEDSLAIVVWLQFIMACLQVLQTVMIVFAPPIADVIGIVGLGLFLWLLTAFVAAVHGFASLGMVFVMILVSAFGITFVMSLILSVLGIATPGDFNV